MLISWIIKRQHFPSLLTESSADPWPFEATVLLCRKQRRQRHFLIPGEDEGESFIEILLTKDRKAGRSGNELKGAVISIVRPY